LHEIGRAFGKEHSSIRCLVSRHGGIAPAVRRRALLALTLPERERLPPKFVLALIAAEEWELAEFNRSFSGKAAPTSSARAREQGARQSRQSALH